MLEIYQNEILDQQFASQDRDASKHMKIHSSASFSFYSSSCTCATKICFLASPVEQVVNFLHQVVPKCCNDK